MENVSNLKWSVNIAITLQKTGFLKKKFLKNFSAKDRTGDLKVMSSLTRPLHQKNLLEIWARKNALSSVGNYCSKTKAAGISNAQIFKSLRSASNFIWQVGNPNSFGMCSGCSKVYVASFFLIFGDLFFKDAKLPHLIFNLHHSTTSRTKLIWRC